MSAVHPATPMGEPSVPAPERTPGQALFQALYADGSPLVMPMAWRFLPEPFKRVYERGADAVAAPLRAQRDDYMNDLAVKIRERDAARAGRDKLDADCQLLAATLTRLGNSHADLREQRDAYRELLREAGIADTTPAEEDS